MILRNLLLAAFLLTAGLIGATVFADNKAPPEQRPDDVMNLPSRSDGILLVLGTEIKDGDKVPANDVVTVKIDGQERHYRRIKVGDKVEEGQVIGRLDDSLARFEVEVSSSNLMAAESRRSSSQKTKEEAETRLTILQEQVRRIPGSIPLEELRGAQLTAIRYRNEESASAAEVRLAQVNLKRAEQLLSQYEIRAVRGEITAILKRRGEAVRAYETVVRIRPDEKDR